MLSSLGYRHVTRHESQNAQAQQVLLVSQNMNHHYVETVTREAILFISKDYGSIPKPFLNAGTERGKETDSKQQFYSVSVGTMLVHWMTANKFIKIMPLPVPVAARSKRRRSAAVHLPSLWVRIPKEAWMSLCCECCVLSGRGLCDKLIPRPEEP
jgi:hypothetical protein